MAETIKVPKTWKELWREVNREKKNAFKDLRAKPIILN